MGYDLVTMKECSYLSEIGKPMMPVKRIMIALPNGMKATNIQTPYNPKATDTRTLHNLSSTKTAARRRDL